MATLAVARIAVARIVVARIVVTRIVVARKTVARFPLASPDILAASIVEDLQSALEQFMAIAEDLGGSNMSVGGK